jgi:hypothetical protein
MNFQGILIGVLSFLIIGIFHPIVIKCEYYFTEKVWGVFLVLGLLFIACSVWVHNMLGSSLLGVLGFTCLWSIKELKEQTQRVAKGWYPKNPKRK